MERYGLFKRLPDGSPYWVGAAHNLEEAKKKIQDLSKAGGEYFVHDLKSGETVASIGTREDRRKSHRPPHGTPKVDRRKQDA
jgi:hypothetical protein